MKKAGLLCKNWINCALTSKISNFSNIINFCTQNIGTQPKRWHLTSMRHYFPSIETTIVSCCRGGKKKAAGALVSQWDWDGQREKILRCISSCTEIDLWKLFRPKGVDSRLLERWMQMVRSQFSCYNSSVNTSLLIASSCFGISFSLPLLCK